MQSLKKQKNNNFEIINSIIRRKYPAIIFITFKKNINSCFRNLKFLR